MPNTIRPSSCVLMRRSLLMIREPFKSTTTGIVVLGVVSSLIASYLWTMWTASPSTQMHGRPASSPSPPTTEIDAVQKAARENARQKVESEKEDPLEKAKTAILGSWKNGPETFTFNSDGTILVWKNGPDTFTVNSDGTILGSWKNGPDTVTFNSDGTAYNDGIPFRKYHFVDSTHVVTTAPDGLSSLTFEVHLTGSDQYLKQKGGGLWNDVIWHRP